MALVDEIEQSARAGDENIDAIAHSADLRSLADTSVNDCLAERHVFSVGGKAFANLNGEFTGRGEHQAAWTARTVLAGSAVERVEDGKCETSSLARAGLGATEEVAAF